MSQEPAKTPGWSSGVLSFSAMILVVIVGIYFALVAYGSVLNGKVSSVQSQVASLDQSIASGDQAQLVAFYSQIVNLQSVLRNHVLFSQFLTWLQSNTEVNVYYTQMSFASGNQVTLSAVARTEADVNQQIAIFESSPLVAKVGISSVANSNTTGLWAFTVVLVMQPSVFVATPAAAVVPVSSSTTP